MNLKHTETSDHTESSHGDSCSQIYLISWSVNPAFIAAEGLPGPNRSLKSENESQSRLIKTNKGATPAFSARCLLAVAAATPPAHECPLTADSCSVLFDGTDSSQCTFKNMMGFHNGNRFIMASLANNPPKVLLSIHRGTSAPHFNSVTQWQSTDTGRLCFSPTFTRGKKQSEQPLGKQEGQLEHLFPSTMTFHLRWMD